MARALAGVPQRRAWFVLSPLLAVALLCAQAGAARAGDIATADAAGSDGVGRPLGYDVSYPQCGGQLPENVAFAVVGVNGGRVYSPNPCLGAGAQASQLEWAGPGADLYANTANPGPRISEYWPVGQTQPRPCLAEDDDSLDCAYDYGWNAAADSYATALSAYVSLGWADADDPRLPEATRWWLDVETANSWRADPARNVAALQGAVDFLESVDVESVGFYSAPRMWQAITGGTDAFSDHPSWVAGASTLRGAMEVCRGDGFTGGPVAMAQYFAHGFDANHRC